MEGRKQRRKTRRQEGGPLHGPPHADSTRSSSTPASCTCRWASGSPIPPFSFQFPTAPQSPCLHASTPRKDALGIPPTAIPHPSPKLLQTGPYQRPHSTPCSEGNSEHPTKAPLPPPFLPFFSELQGQRCPAKHPKQSKGNPPEPKIPAKGHPEPLQGALTTEGHSRARMAARSSRAMARCWGTVGWGAPTWSQSSAGSEPAATPGTP